MKISRRQTFGIGYVVEGLGGNPKIVKRALKKLSSWELLSTPRPKNKYLSRQDKEALGVIERNLTDPKAHFSLKDSLKILEDVITNRFSKKELLAYIKGAEIGYDAPTSFLQSIEQALTGFRLFAITLGGGLVCLVAFALFSASNRENNNHDLKGFRPQPVVPENTADRESILREHLEQNSPQGKPQFDWQPLDFPKETRK